MNKTCTKCGEEKSTAEFSNRKAAPDGKMPECRVCNAERAKASRAVNRGVQKERIDRWRADNATKVKAYEKAYREENRSATLERTRKWRAANPEAVVAYTRAYGKANSDKLAANYTARQAAKLKAIPNLSELDAEFNVFCLQEAYRLSRQRSKLTGIKWNVDHIVPLRSKLVCGFHSYTNVRVITAKENQVKSNKFWEDMWQC